MCMLRSVADRLAHNGFGVPCQTGTTTEVARELRRDMQDSSRILGNRLVKPLAQTESFRSPAHGDRKSSSEFRR